MPTGFGDGRPPLDDFQYQRRLPARRPTLDLFFLYRAHGCLLDKVTPEQEITGSLQNPHLPGEALSDDAPTTAKPTLAPPLATAQTARKGRLNFLYSNLFMDGFLELVSG